MDELDKLIMKHSSNVTGKCKFFREEGSVDCDAFSRCETCGWNPAVEEKRKKKIREDTE